MPDSTTIKFPERLSGLDDLVHNLWWSWHPAARMLFKMLDRQGWKETHHNPVKLIRELPSEILERAAKDPIYLKQYDRVMALYRKSMEPGESWLSETPDPNYVAVAYFSAEYGLQRSLPFYAGGLGFLAGDYIKECSDLGVPLVAIGFMYPEGYLRQKIRTDGWQENISEPLDRDAAPITRVFDREEKHLIVKVPFIEPPIHVAVWKVMVGRIPLYLMDTDIEINEPWNRAISAHLYIGDNEQRLRQEIVLGIGGSEILNVLGIRHAILHLNEGHPAFAILEKIREMTDDHRTYAEAARIIQATTVFTTHTPVAAGNDVYSFDLMDKYFRRYYPLLGLTREAFFEIGASPHDPSAGFNMTAFALRMSNYRNGVSKKHGEVARRMWQSLWPGLKPESVPIASITNGIHLPTWIEPRMELLLDRYLGADWQSRQDDPNLWNGVAQIPDEEIWRVHWRMKRKLFDFIHDRIRRRWSEDRVDAGHVVAGGTLFDLSTLTIGFARRFVTYKRADLIFTNLDRLTQILTNRRKPVQILFSGKAHPSDDLGKRILQRIFNFSRDPRFEGRVAFVEDYDEQLAQYMTHGVDIWLNNPLPPMEACGTSGMKASLNGVPQLSILDGWWIEGYNGKNGWALKGQEGNDIRDAEEIYDLLEREIVPLYYALDQEGLPRQWIVRMKESIKSVGAVFGARRMVKEYRERFYRNALKSV